MECEASSWEPEVYSFYGSGELVLDKLDKIDMNLPNRRLYLFLLEGEGAAELRVFEKVGDYGAGEKAEVEVSQWSDGSAGDLRERIHDAILENKGVNCVGEQTKALVADRVEIGKRDTVPAPVSPRAAFAHSLQRHGDAFVRGSVFLMC